MGNGMERCDSRSGANEGDGEEGGNTEGRGGITERERGDY